MKDIFWLIRNGYKDVTSEMKQSGMVPTDVKWMEWSMGKSKFVTTNNKIYAKD